MQQHYSAKLLFFSFLISFQQNANAKLCSSISVSDCNTFEIRSNGKIAPFAEIIYGSNTLQAATNLVSNNNPNFSNTATFIFFTSVVDLSFDISRKMALTLSGVTLQTVGRLTSVDGITSQNSLYTQKLL